MSGLLAKYRERVQHEHGWEVELSCPKCTRSGLPKYNGWTPSQAIHVGNTPTIYANVTCSDCGCDLRQEAEIKLVELFADATIPPQNKGLIYSFIFVIVCIPVLLAGFIWLGVMAGWWGYRAFIWLNLLFVIIGPAILWFNYKVASIRFSCECGHPKYLFMGMLGRSYCYRCSNCGKLLRVRD